MSIVQKKKWTENYPPEIVGAFNAMSFDKSKIVLAGTASIKGMLYAGDFDAVEATFKPSAKSFQKIIKGLLKRKNTIIGDIKCGEKTEWKVLPETFKLDGERVMGYNRSEILSNLKKLYKKKVINKEELKEAEGLLVAKPTPLEALEIMDALRPEVMRWKPQDVLRGYLTLRDGSTFPLQKGIDQNDKVFKLDTIVFSEGRYRELSLIYMRQYEEFDFVKELKQEVVDYRLMGRYFKAMKRLFTIARWEKNEMMIKRLFPIMNGDLGVLYSLISDIDTLLYLLDNKKDISKAKMKYEISHFGSRLSNLYENASILSEEDKWLREIKSIENVGANEQNLERLKESLEKKLNEESKRIFPTQTL